MLILVNTVNGHICDCYCPYFVGIMNYYSCTTVTCTQACALSPYDACRSSPTVSG